VQGRQGIEGTGRLSSRCPSAVKLVLLLSGFNSWLRPHWFEATFIWYNVHLRPYSLKTTFTWDHIYLRPNSYETTFTWDFFIWDKIHLRSHSFYATLKWSCFDLLWIRFLWSTFRFFVGDLKFYEVTIHLKFCKVTSFRVHGWLTLGCKCTRTLRHRNGQKTLQASGLARSVASLKCYLV